MKKVIALYSFLGSLFITSIVYAQPQDIRIVPPNLGISPATPIGTLLSNALVIIFIVAAILVLFILVWGAFEWITSGGDKEGVGKARGKIINSLIGLAILALAFLIVVVVGGILNIDILNLRRLPTLQNQCALHEAPDPTSPTGCTAKCLPGTQFWNPPTGTCEPLVNITTSPAR